MSEPHHTPQAQSPDSTPLDPKLVSEAREFVDRYLGAHSSHPSMEGVRLRFWLICSLAPLVLVLLVLVLWFFLARPSGVAEYADHVLRFIRWGFLALVMGMAIGLSALLSTRAIAAPSFARSAQSERPAHTVVQWSALVLSLAGLAFGAAFLSDHASGFYRWLLLLGSILPFILIDSALAFRRQEQKDDGPAVALRFLGGVVLSAGAIALALTATADFSDFVTEWGERLLDRLIGAVASVPLLGGLAVSVLTALKDAQIARFSGIVVLGIIAIVLASRLRVLAGAKWWSRFEQAESKGTQEAENKEKKKPIGCLGRVLGWCVGIFGSTPKVDPAQVSTDAAREKRMEDWRVELERRFKEQFGERSQQANPRLSFSRQQSGRETRSSSTPFVGADQRSTATDYLEERRSHDWLFAGHAPSPTQFVALQRFRQRYVRVAKSLEQMDASGIVMASRNTPDMLVMSEPGAGRTTTLIAMAIQAAVGRGQRVLYVTSDLEESKLVAELTNQALKLGYMHHLVKAAAGVTADHPWVIELVQDLSAPSQARERREGILSSGDHDIAAPQILVAQVEEMEELLFGAGKRSTAMRAFLNGVGVVIVDSLDPLVSNPTANIHIPFWLDKLRLRSECSGFPLQVVVGLPPIHSSGSGGQGALPYLKNRLLGTADDDDESVVELQPIRNTKKVVIDAQADGASEQQIIVALVKALGEMGRKVVVFKSDLDPTAKRELESALRSNIDAHLQPIVVTNYARMSDPEVRDATVVVLRDASGGRSIVRIASRLTSEDTVFFRVGVDSSRPWDSGLSTTLPVLAGRGAEPLQAMHLMSVVPVMNMLAPVRYDRLLKFGLLRPEQYHDRESPFAPRAHTALSTWSVVIDAPAYERFPEQDRPFVWDMAYFSPVKNGVPVMRKVDFHTALDESLFLTRTQQAGNIAVFSCASAVDRRRFVAWCDRHGLPLGSMDLSSASEFVFFTPVVDDPKSRVRWKPREVERAGLSQRILAVPWSDEQIDQLLPILKLDFEVHSKTSFRTSPTTLLAKGMSVHVSSATGQPVTANFKISEIASEAGSRQDIVDLEWSQHARVSVVRFGMPIAEEEADAHLLVNAHCGGFWDTSTVADLDGGVLGQRSFWPLLTYVWQEALRIICPDFSRFGRIAAFHAPTGLDGAVVFILEPLSTASSAPEALQAILEDPSLCGSLRKAMVEIVGARVDAPLPASAPTYKNGFGRMVTATEAQYCLDQIARAFDGVPSDAISVPAQSGFVRCAPRLSSERVPGGTAVSGQFGVPASREFVNHNAVAWRSDAEGRMGPLGEGPRFGYQLDLTTEHAEAATKLFGANLTVMAAQVSEAAEGVRRERGLRVRSDGLAEIDYAWMIESSIDSLRPLARSLLDLCKSAGLDSRRSQVGLFAAAVQAFRYEAQREHPCDDGLQRFGVQMPVATMVDAAGDCDSFAVLLAALLRAGGVCRAGVVLVGPTVEARRAERETAVGHAMVAVEVEVTDSDDVLEIRHASAVKRLVLIEATSPWPLGVIDRAYDGRSVMLLEARLAR